MEKSKDNMVTEKYINWSSKDQQREFSDAVGFLTL